MFSKALLKEVRKSTETFFLIKKFVLEIIYNYWKVAIWKNGNEYYGFEAQTKSDDLTQEKDF